jgi:hypothetical protein
VKTDFGRYLHSGRRVEIPATPEAYFIRTSNNSALASKNARFFWPYPNVSVHLNGQAFEKVNSVWAISTQLYLVLIPILGTGTRYFDPEPARETKN